jgi:hypothetical protein
MQFTLTDSNNKPVTQAWIVRQVCPQAFCTDQAHAGAGVWVLPKDTTAGSREVVVESAWTGHPAIRGTITWTPRTRH